MQERLALADEALAMARRLDQPATLAYLLRSWDLVHRLPWFLDDRLARGRRARGAGRPAG